MSKFTFNLVISLLTIVSRFLIKSISAVRTIVDLLDDGVINGSTSLPEFVEKISEVLTGLTETLDKLYGCQDSLQLNKPSE